MATEKTIRSSKKSGTRSSMSAAHKSALAKGRDEGRVVRRYLEALEQTKPRRGRKRTPESIQKRLAAIDVEFADADALSRLQLTQEEIDLEAELATYEDTLDIPSREKDFVKVAGAYGSRKGISYSAWRSVGVSAAVLKEAGVSRTRR